MPQERENPFPFPTAQEVEEAPGAREEKSARFVIARHIPGPPRRAYLLGGCDHAPIYQGVTDLTRAAWELIDALRAAQKLSPQGAGTMYACDKLEEILSHHDCPDPRVEPEAEDHDERK